MENILILANLTFFSEFNQADKIYRNLTFFYNVLP